MDSFRNCYPQDLVVSSKMIFEAALKLAEHFVRRSFGERSYYEIRKSDTAPADNRRG
jgi:hypothetical protein